MKKCEENLEKSNYDFVIFFFCDSYLNFNYLSFELSVTQRTFSFFSFFNSLPFLICRSIILLFFYILCFFSVSNRGEFENIFSYHEIFCLFYFFCCCYFFDALWQNMHVYNLWYQLCYKQMLSSMEIYAKLWMCIAALRW